jgi:hypothetical protein
MFFFPKSTLRIRLFDEQGKTHWETDRGPGVVPGIWFCPMYAFDLNQDGTVYDRTGKLPGNVGGLTAMCSKFTSRPGEQILLTIPKGRCVSGPT